MFLKVTETSGDEIYINTNKIIYFKSWDQFTIVVTETRDFYVTDTVKYLSDMLMPKIFIPVGSNISPDDCL